MGGIMPGMPIPCMGICPCPIGAIMGGCAILDDACDAGGCPLAGRTTSKSGFGTMGRGEAPAAPPFFLPPFAVLEVISRMVPQTVQYGCEAGTDAPQTHVMFSPSSPPLAAAALLVLPRPLTACVMAAEAASTSAAELALAIGPGMAPIMAPALGMPAIIGICPCITGIWPGMPMGIIGCPCIGMPPIGICIT